MAGVPVSVRARAVLELRRREAIEGKVISGVVYMPRRSARPVPPADLEARLTDVGPEPGRDAAARLAAAMDQFKRSREKEGR